MKIKFVYDIRGEHTYFIVFVNGANTGKLCFRNEEFEIFKKEIKSIPWSEFWELGMEFEKAEPYDPASM